MALQRHPPILTNFTKYYGRSWDIRIRCAWNNLIMKCCLCCSISFLLLAMACNCKVLVISMCMLYFCGFCLSYFKVSENKKLINNGVMKLSKLACKQCLSFAKMLAIIYPNSSVWHSLVYHLLSITSIHRALISESSYNVTSFKQNGPIVTRDCMITRVQIHTG